jgi:outer membrane protein assembly factor BamB
VASGKEAWATAHGAAFHNDRGDGPRGTPTVDGDRVYALGGDGDLSCLEAKTGKIVWTLNVLQKFGGSNIQWGISESPLVIGEKVLVNAGGPNASMVALNKKDGSVIWKSQSDEEGYSSAIALETAGGIQVVFFTADRVVGLDLKDGKLRWEYKRPSNRTANVYPIGRGNRVHLGIRRAAPVGSRPMATPRKFISIREMMNHHSSSILIGITYTGFQTIFLTAMRFDSGEVV